MVNGRGRAGWYESKWKKSHLKWRKNSNCSEDNAMSETHNDVPLFKISRPHSHGTIWKDAIYTCSFIIIIIIIIRTTQDTDVR